MKTPSSPHPWPSPPLSSLREWQFGRLRRYLSETVLPFSAHYRGLFEREGLDLRAFRTADDLRRIPFTSKADFLAAAPGADPVRDFVLQPDRALLRRRPSTIARALWHGRAAVQAVSSASFDRSCSPAPRAVPPSPCLSFTRGHDIANLELAGARIMRVCGAEPAMRMMNMFPFAPHLAFWITHYAGTEFGVFVLGTGGGKVMGTEGNLRLLKKIKPEVVIGMPTFLYHVLTEAVREGLELPNLRKLVLGGEKAPTGMRRKFRALAAQLGAAPRSTFCAPTASPRASSPGPSAPSMKTRAQPATTSIPTSR